jgi:hypothetical protein
MVLVLFRELTISGDSSSVTFALQSQGVILFMKHILVALKAWKN